MKNDQTLELQFRRFLDAEELFSVMKARQGKATRDGRGQNSRAWHHSIHPPTSNVFVV